MDLEQYIYQLHFQWLQFIKPALVLCGLLLFAFFWRWKLLRKLHVVACLVFAVWWYIQYKGFAEKSSKQIYYDLDRGRGSKISVQSLPKFDYQYFRIESERNSTVRLDILPDDFQTLITKANRDDLAIEFKDTLKHTLGKK